MSWLDYLMNAMPIKSIFHVTPPLIDVRILEVRLHEDGPRVSLRIDLNTYPENPPQKWKLKKCNRVQVTLVLIDIIGIDIQGWGANNIGSIEITGQETGVRLVFVADGTKIDCQAQFADIEKIAAYQSDE